MIGNTFSSILLFLAIPITGLLPALAQITAPARPKAPAAASSAKKTGRAAKAGPSAGEQDAATADLHAIRKPPLPEFHPQEPKRIQLTNGMVIFLQEDHELPLIDGSATVRGGSKSEPEDKTGLVSIYGEAWRTGGTRDETGDEVDDLLEARAAELETDGATPR